MVWWRRAWGVRLDDGPNLRTAKVRRSVWRAATKAAEEIRDGNWTDEVQDTSNNDKSCLTRKDLPTIWTVLTEEVSDGAVESHGLTRKKCNAEPRAAKQQWRCHQSPKQPYRITGQLGVDDSMVIFMFKETAGALLMEQGEDDCKAVPLVGGPRRRGNRLRSQ